MRQATPQRDGRRAIGLWGARGPRRITPSLSILRRIENPMAYGSSLHLRDAHVAARGRARSPHAWDGVPRRIGGIVTLK